MRVLVVSKTPTLDVLGEYVRKKVDDEKLSSTYLEKMQRGYDDHKRTLDALHFSLRQYGVEYMDVRSQTYWPEIKDFDAVIAVGGDGTVLDASHHIDDSTVPMIGLRSSPLSVGYLCSANIDEIDGIVQSIKNGLLKVVEVSRLQAVIFSLNENRKVVTEPVLNDFLYCNANPAATTRYKINVEGISETQKSSGIWFSTAAGSSAAILCAGGEQVPITQRDFQFSVRELYVSSLDGKSVRQGFFDPEKQSIMIENLCESAMLALDGHHRSYMLSFGDQVQFQRAKSLSLVTGVRR